MTDADVIIVGGGANGTGLARDLAKRGVRVLLCEKTDFAAGATGASSGMIHGGPRYMLDDVETTRHSCEDSAHIQRIVPHLLFRVPFLVPVPTDSMYGRMFGFLHDAYFSLYDRFSALKNGIPHARVTNPELRRIEPRLRGRYLGGVTFDEWGIDPGRLCVLNALDARGHGADLEPYTEIVGLMRGDDGRVMGARLRRAGELGVREVTAKAVVNCGGPWAEKVAGLAGGGARLRPGKGVHLVFEKRLTNFAIVTPAVDGRQVFVMPYQNETWIGTTDDDYYGDLDHLTAQSGEVRYLLEAVERILPGISKQRMISTRVGVRNTIHGWGQYADALSRRYEIVDHAGNGAAGFFSLLGGKLASFRVQAEDMANVICTTLGNHVDCRTHIDPVPGGVAGPDEQELARIYGIGAVAARRLIARHGALASRVLDLGRETPTGFDVVCACEPTLECEVRYCIRNELVLHAGDLMARCRVAVGPCQGTDCALRVAQLFAEERSLDADGEREALMDLLTRRWRAARPVLRGQQLAQAELLMTQYTGLWKLPTLRPHA